MSTSVDDAIIRNSTISPKKLDALSKEVSEVMRALYYLFKVCLIIFDSCVLSPERPKLFHTWLIEHQ